MTMKERNTEHVDAYFRFGQPFEWPLGYGDSHYLWLQFIIQPLIISYCTSTKTHLRNNLAYQMPKQEEKCIINISLARTLLTGFNVSASENRALGEIYVHLMTASPSLLLFQLQPCCYGVSMAILWSCHVAVHGCCLFVFLLLNGMLMLSTHPQLCTEVLFVFESLHVVKYNGVCVCGGCGGRGFKTQLWIWIIIYITW